MSMFRSWDDVERELFDDDEIATIKAGTATAALPGSGCDRAARSCEWFAPTDPRLVR